jgi:hypothetical protein
MNLFLIKVKRKIVNIYIDPKYKHRVTAGTRTAQRKSLQPLLYFTLINWPCWALWVCEDEDLKLLGAM